VVLSAHCCCFAFVLEFASRRSHSPVRRPTQMNHQQEQQQQQHNATIAATHTQDGGL
jgi:hypothetical protein